MSEADRQLVVIHLQDTAEDGPLPSTEVSLHSILDWYWNDHARKIPSKVSAQIAISYWKDFFEADLLVSKLTRPKLGRFVEHLREQKLSEGYISRTLSVGRAALKRAQRDGVIETAPFVADNETKRDKRNKEPKGRPLSIDEVARLFLSAEPNQLQMFLAILISTLCRPDAALDLGPQQIDARWNVVDLNPKGRKQTNKFRPKVPLIGPLRLVDADHAVRTFVNVSGEPLKRINRSWRTMVRKSGLPDGNRISPYSIRHTMARELGARNVSQQDIGLFLGHLPTGALATTAIYNPYQPSYIAEAAAAVEAYTGDLGKEIIRQAMEMEMDLSSRPFLSKIFRFGKN